MKRWRGEGNGNLSKKKDFGKKKAKQLLSKLIKLAISDRELISPF